MLFLRLKSPLRRCGKYPLSLLTTFAASSPKGTPYGTAGNFVAAAKAVLLRADLPRPGEDVAQRQKGESVAVGDWGSSGSYPFRLAASRQATFPKGTAFGGGDKVSGAA